MDTVFAYGGNHKSALTPPTILFGAMAYSITYPYASIGTVGPLPISPEATAVMSNVQVLQSVPAVDARISQIDVAIANLTQFEKDTRVYYDNRVNRTSGGKRDRLREERESLCKQALAQLALLRSARASAVRLAHSLAISEQDDYNPSTGVALTPVEKQVQVAQAQAKAAASGGFNPTTLLIPVGAALAALFFLKGN